MKLVGDDAMKENSPKVIEMSQSVSVLFLKQRKYSRPDKPNNTISQLHNQYKQKYLSPEMDMSAYFCIILIFHISVIFCQSTVDHKD